MLAVVHVASNEPLPVVPFSKNGVAMGGLFTAGSPMSVHKTVPERNS